MHISLYLHLSICLSICIVHLGALRVFKRSVTQLRYGRAAVGPMF